MDTLDSSAYDYRADPVLGAMLAYWERKRASQSMPRRRDIDPAEIPRLLPHVQLVEATENRGFRYRLVGTGLVEAFGHDYTGHYVDEQFPGERGVFIRGIYDLVCSGSSAIFVRNKYVTKKQIDLVANRLYMPLSEDGVRVTLILGALTFEYGEAPVSGAWKTASMAAAAPHVEKVNVA
jgi:hypothetical protein